PAFDTTEVSVKELPVFTDVGFATSVTARSAFVGFVARDDAVAELLVRSGSLEGIAKATDAVSPITVFGVILTSPFTVNTKLGVAPTAKLAIVQVIVPVLPTAGSGQLH